MYYNVGNFSSKALSNNFFLSAKGYYKDILNNLEDRFNFTTTLYKRHDNVWGMPNLLKNGTVLHYGMIKNVVEGSSEFGLAAFGYDPFRAQFVDHFPFITTGYLGIFTAAEIKHEEPNWKLYLNILKRDLWLSILTISIISASISYISKSIYLRKLLVSQVFLLP